LVQEDDDPGLTLYFNTRLTPFDQFLIPGVIFGVLGNDTDCRVAEYREEGEAAIVRLEAESREDLEAVADALWERVWEQHEKAQNQALVRLSGVLTDNLQQGLSALVEEKLEGIILRVLTEDGVEWIGDKGEEHVRTKDLRTVRAWPEKFTRAAWEAAVKKATGLAGKEAEGLVEAGVKGLLGDGEGS